MTPMTITADNFEAEVLQSDVPVVLDFWAPWCGPCRSLGPVLDQLSGEYAGRVKVGKVNVDEQPALAGAFQVRGIPHVAAVEGNTVVDQQVGFRGRAPLEAMFAGLVSKRA